MKKYLLNAAKILLVLLLLYSPLFMHLGDLPIRIWDEARLVSNALEMQKDGDFIVTHYNGQPDMWNTKPPLMIWSQLLFLNIFGNKEIAFRMPSAIAGLLTCLFLLLVSWRYLKSYWYGLIAIMILITTDGYVGDHVTRTGDYDAMLTLFTTISSLAIFLWSEYRQSKFIHWFFLGLILGIMTKGVQALMILPAIAVYILMTQNLVALLKNKWVYIDFIILILITGGYYLARESMNHGYLEAVSMNELGGRFLNTIENHKHGFTYFLDLLYNKQFSIWFIFFFAGIVFTFIFTKGIIRRLTLYSTLSVITYLLLISFSNTKLAWYTAPLFPLLALVCANGIYMLYLKITDGSSYSISSQTPRIIAFIMLIMFFFYPYYTIIDKVYKPRETRDGEGFYMLSHYLMESTEGKHNLEGFKVCHDDYIGHLEYYVNRLNTMNVDIEISEPDKLKAGDKVIFHRETVMDKIKDRYEYTELAKYYNVQLLQIRSLKTTPGFQQKNEEVVQ